MQLLAFLFIYSFYFYASAVHVHYNSLLFTHSAYKDANVFNEVQPLGTHEIV